MKNNSNFGSWRPPPGENPGSATGHTLSPLFPLFPFFSISCSFSKSVQNNGSTFEVASPLQSRKSCIRHCNCHPPLFTYTSSEVVKPEVRHCLADFFAPEEVAQAANARGPISNKEEVADSFQACSVCIMEYFHPPDVLI